MTAETLLVRNTNCSGTGFGAVPLPSLRRLVYRGAEAGLLQPPRTRQPREPTLHDRDSGGRARRRCPDQTGPAAPCRDQRRLGGHS